MATTVADLQARLSVDLGDIQGKLRTAIAGLNAANEATKKLANSLDKDVGDAVRKAGGWLDGFRDSAKRVFEVFTGVNLANIIGTIANKVHDLARESYDLGLQSMQAERAFRGMTDAIGINADLLLAKMQAVSGGLVDTSDIMLASARGLQQGLGGAQLVKLLDLAREKAKLAGVDVPTAFNAITDSIAQNNTRSLKQFGIVLELDDVMKAYARTLGTFPEALSAAEKTQAILNATLAAAATQVKSTTTALDANLEAIERQRVRGKQFWTDIGSWIVDAHAKMIGYFDDFNRKAKEAKDFQMGLAGLSPKGVTMPPGAVPAGPASLPLGPPSPTPEQPVVAAIDFLKRALAEADHAAKLLNATLAAGLMTNEEYAASLEAQIGKLEGFAKADEDARLRLLAFKAALVVVQDQIKATSGDLVILDDDFSKAVAGDLKIKLDLIGKQFAVFGDEEARVTAETAALQQAINSLLANGLEPMDPAILALLRRSQDLGAAFEHLHAVAALLEDLPRSLEEADQGAIAETDTWKALGIAWRDAVKMGSALGGAFDLLGTKVTLQTQTIQQLIKDGWDPLGDKVQGARRELEAFRAQQFEKAIESIDTQAKLLGPDFDAVGARLAAVRAEMLRAADAAGGQLTPAVMGLKAEFDRLSDIQKNKALFEDLFGSLQGGIAKMIEGLQLGTRKWKDWGAMALDVIRSVAAELINRLLKAALDPVTQRLAAIASGALTGGAARPGGGGSSGDIDIGGPPMAGGGGGFNLPSIPTGIFDLGMLSNLWAGLSNAWGAFNAALESGTSVVEALSSAWDSFLVPLSGAASGLSVALAGVGAAVAVFGTIMDFVNGQTEAAIGGVVGGTVGAVAGGLVGTYIFPGVGTVLGALVGGALGDFLGSLLGGLFGGPSNYDLKRIKAADEANAALGSVAGGYQTALNTGDLAQILAALQHGAGGSGNSVRTELVLPSGLAAQMGITGQQIGDQIVAQWSSLTLEQFQQVIAAFKENPSLIQSIRGSGDVPYLSSGDAQAIADQIAQGAQALLTAFIDMEKVRDKITQLAVDLGKSAQDILPPDIAAAFSAGIVDPIRDRMLAVLSSGIPVAEMQKQMEALGQEMQAYVGLVTLYSANAQTIASLAGDIATQTKGAILAITTSLDLANKAVEDATSRSLEAISPAETLAANAQLREAILSRYKLELDLVTQIQASIAGLLDKVGAPAAANSAMAATYLLSQGDVGPFNEIYAALVNMARDAPTVAQRLYAISQGMALVIAAFPTSAGFFANGSSIYAPQGAGSAGMTPPTQTIPDQIVTQLAQNVAPFFAALADMLATAVGAGDLQGQLTLLQAQAQLIQQVAAAAIEAVQAWAKAAIDATNTAAAALGDAIRANYTLLRDFINKTADDQITAIEAQRDADIAANQAIIDSNLALIAANQTLIDANQAQIEANNLLVKANNLRLKGLQEEQAALQAALTAAQAWRSAVGGITDYITQLRRSTMSPEMQFSAAQGDYQAALASYRANPSAAGLTVIQQLAQALLQSAGAIPGAATGGLTQAIISDLEAMKALAPKDTVDQLQAQLDGIAAQTTEIQASNEALAAANDKLAETNKALSDANAALTAANQTLKDLNTKIAADAQTQIDWWNEWRQVELDKAALAEAADLALVEKWRAAQVLAIQDTAEATIDGIKAGTAAALLDNSKAQNAIMNELIVSQMEQLKAITGGMPVQDFIAQESHKAAVALEEIQASLEAFLLAAAGGPTVPQLASGADYIRRPMLAQLHEGEGVLTKEQNARRGEGGDVHISVVVHAGEDWPEMEEKLLHSVRWGRLAQAIKRNG